MPFTIAAPYPGEVISTVLPNPEFGNSEAATLGLNLKRSMNGTVRTYVKRKGRRKHIWEFQLTRNKAIEIREFVRFHHATKLLVTDHDDRQWAGFILNNPLEIESTKRAAPGRQGLLGETYTVTVEFEGIQIGNDPRSAKPIALDAFSTINASQMLNGITPLPVTGQKYHWDANEITGYSDGDQLLTWDELINNKDLTATARLAYKFPNIIPTSVTNLFPEYYTNIFGGLPGVYFGTVPNTTVTAEMRTAATDINFFPGRKGTVFWVFKHSMGPPPGLLIGNTRFPALTDPFALWSIKQTTTSIEGISMPGGGSNARPLSWHPRAGSRSDSMGERDFNDPDNGDFYIIHGRPYIYTLIRNFGTNLRFRLNGTEQLGATIPNASNFTGKLRLHTNEECWTESICSQAHGFWGELLVYPRALKTSEIDKVEKHLALKWGAPLNRLWFPHEECHADICIEFPQYCNQKNGVLDQKAIELFEDVDFNCIIPEDIGG